jgi:hypothetical protein
MRHQLGQRASETWIGLEFKLGHAIGPRVGVADGSDASIERRGDVGAMLTCGVWGRQGECTCGTTPHGLREAFHAMCANGLTRPRVADLTHAGPKGQAQDVPTTQLTCHALNILLTSCPILNAKRVLPPSIPLPVPDGRLGLTRNHLG